MSKLAITGARVVDPEESEPREEILLVEQGCIRERLPAHETPGEDWERVPLDDRLVAPGFIDLHFHGELVVAPPEDFGGALERASTNMLRAGTTAFLATTMAWPRDSLGGSVAALAEIIARGPGEGATCLGLHLEGPWISPEAPGAMSVDCIRPFEPGPDREIFDRADGLLRMVTLAPEITGADALLGELASRGVIAALGHSRASQSEIEAGIDQGLRHVTHLFNAMGPIHHREPGVAAAVMAEDRISCDLICDGFHVHPALVRIAARAIRDRLLLITDRVDLQRPDPALADAEAAGEDPEPNRLPQGTLLGSRLDLDRAVRNLRTFADLSLCEAVAAVTLRPARLLGIENQRGTLRRGSRADLAVLDDQGRVVETWIAGRRRR